MQGIEPNTTIMANGEHLGIRSARDRQERLREYAIRFAEFEDCENERAFLIMASPWLLDMDQLMTRRQAHSEQPKPRIALNADLTSKGNFRLCWEPTRYDGNKTDFCKSPSPYDYHAIGNRPDHELLFIRRVRDPIWHLASAREEGIKGPYRGNIDGAYLFAVHQSVETLVRRLDFLFEISWINKFVIETAKDEDGRSYLVSARFDQINSPPVATP